MKLGIYTKTEMAGGSEFRAVEMANAILKYTEHKPFLFTDSRKIPMELISVLNPEIKLVLNAPEQHKGLIYEMDHLLVINTDSRQFTTLDYWHGKSDRHQQTIDISKLKAMSFLFNFIVSPARHLNQIVSQGVNVSIITTNRRYYDELSSKDKHKDVRAIPRLILESPINPESVSTHKFNDNLIRIGKHSHAAGNKFCEETAAIIKSLNQKHKNIIWDFMGVPDNHENPRKMELKQFRNVIIRDTFSLPVKDYLEGIDIFFFNISKDRIEPGARAVSEAMLSGCPIIAWQRDGGIQRQVVHANNGFLFHSPEACVTYIDKLVSNKSLLKTMGQNSRMYARDYCSDRIIERYIRHVESLMERS